MIVDKVDVEGFRSTHLLAAIFTSAALARNEERVILLATASMRRAGRRRMSHLPEPFAHRRRLR